MSTLTKAERRLTAHIKVLEAVVEAADDYVRYVPNIKYDSEWQEGLRAQEGLRVRRDRLLAALQRLQEGNNLHGT